MNIKDSLPAYLMQWSTTQHQKHEVLQKELLKERKKNKTLENRLKSLLEMLNGVDLDNPIPKTQTPLNPYLELNTEVSKMSTENQEISNQEIQEKLANKPNFFVPLVTKELICEYKKKSFTGTEHTKMYYIKKSGNTEGNKIEFLIEKTDTTWFGKDYSIIVDDIMTAKEIFKDLARG